MHKIEGHEAFFYYTANMQKGVSFYKHVVGLHLIVEDAYWSVFALPDGGRFALHLSEHGMTSTANDQERPMLVLRVENVRDSLDYMNTHAVAAAGPFVSQPWGDEVDLIDPDGNRFRLARLLRD